MGQVWLRRRQYAKALEAFKTAQRWTPRSPYRSMAKPRFTAVRTSAPRLFNLREAVNLDRKFPEAQLGLGDCLVKTKQFDKAKPP